MSDSGGGSSGTQQVVQNNNPPAYALPGIKQGVKDLTANYKEGAPDYYPGQTVAGFSPQQQSSIQGITDLAQGGNTNFAAAHDQLQKTINGDYLNSNPYTDQVMSQLRAPADSAAAMGGRYGSGAHDAAVTGALAPFAYQNYAQERQNQLSAINQVAPLDQAQYYGQQQLGNVGAAVQQQGQNVINADISKYDYNQNKDNNWINQYLATLNGANGSNQTTTSPVNSPSPWSQYAGTGIAAAGLLSQFMGSS